MSHTRSLERRVYLVEMAVGLFFFTAFALLAFYTILLKRDDFFRERHQLQAVFHDVGGIQEGDKVLLRGLNVGKVEALELIDNGQRVKVSMILNRELVFHTKDYVCEIRSFSILGGRNIYLELGDVQSPPIPAGTILAGSSPADVFAEAAKVMGKIDGAVGEIKGFTEDLRGGRGTLYKLVHETELHDQALATVKRLDDSVGKAGDEVAAAAKDLRTLLKDAKVNETLDRVGAAADELKAAANNANAALADARAGKGTVGKLLTDDSLYTNANAAAADLRTLTKRVVEGDSSMALLFRDEGKLYRTIDSSFTNFGEASDAIRTIARKIEKGEGNLGKLVNDDSLYKEIKETVKSIQGAVNDFREQAPISTFGSFLFGAL